ncbi:MAG: S8 family serine peptidase [Alphaproteobacteria bacterium]|nr:S8 family serine peptidase [Alphaproteobacteria bacterium]
MKTIKFIFLSTVQVFLIAAGFSAVAAPATEEPRATPATLADRDGNRLSDGLEAILARTDPRTAVAVVVTFSDPAGNAAAARQAVGPFAVSREYSLIHGFAATVTAGQARALAALPGVFRVEEDGQVSAMLDVSRPAFGVDAAQADPLAGGLGLTGTGVGICTVDTGILATHEQFIDGAGTSKLVAFVDFVNGQTAPYDDNGHGTVVAGIAAGDGGGSTATATALRGVAPGASLYAAKVLDATGSGALSNVAAAIEWCAGQTGVDIISMSLGTAGSSDGQDVMSLAANAATDAGKLVVIAAGNQGAAPGTIGAPGAAAKAITVGAVAEWAPASSSNWHSAGIYIAPFSGRGPTADGRTKPDIMAPGVSIRSAAAGPLQTATGCTTCYGLASGTSMSTPFTAGVAALVMEANGGPLSPAAIRDILLTTAQPRGEVAGKDNEWGFGLIDAWAAVQQAMGASVADYAAVDFPSYTHGRGSVANSGVTRIPIETVDPSKPLAVTVTIDGKIARLGWKPDLEAILLDADGNPFLINIPLFGDVPVPGTISTCAAGDECGAVGRQETVHIRPPLAAGYILEIWPYEGFPNKGAGGSFTYELSNGRSTGDAPAPGTALIASAGLDQSVIDGDKNGVETIELDGSASGPFGTIASWQWDWTDADGPHTATGIAPVLTLPVGEHSITLSVADIYGITASDTVLVTVSAGKSGGGKPGSSGGGKKNGK